MKSARSRGSDERGVVLVWLAITLVLLLGVTALGIDVAYWQVTKNREQRAADAAALAGAVTFPGDPVQSDVQAQGVASDNGYTVGAVTPLSGSGTCPMSGTTTVCTGAGDRAYQYKVVVAQKVNNFFGGIFGIGSTTVRTSAQAEYLGPLKMGSPSNQFGNDPDATATNQQTYPNFWANINGGGTAKEQGDAYAANWCDGDGTNGLTGSLFTDGCTAVGNGNNTDYTSNGYYYAVDFTGDGSANLQVFDPAFVNVGQYCDGGNGLAAAAALPLASIPGYPENAADIARRFQPVADATDPADPGFRYCSGDNSFPTTATAANRPNNDGPAPNTTYTVLKATVPGQPESATTVCGPTTFPGLDGNVATALQTNIAFAKSFRQWTSLCTVQGNKGDEFFIQVQTDNNSGGSNHFALRGVNDNTPSGGGAAPVTIAGNTYMGMYANVGTDVLTKFYLVRVPTAAKGHTLLLNFYDIGDANSVGSLQVIPPAESTGNNISSVGSGKVFSNGCQWIGTAADGALGSSKATPNPPWGALSPDAIPDCKISGVNGTGTWQGQWSTVSVPIPSDYMCNDGDPQGCWLTINYLFAGQVHDVTSWTAALLGDPVRLVK